MNELIVNADGTVTVVGDAGSVSGILAELVEALSLIHISEPTRPY